MIIKGKVVDLKNFESGFFLGTIETPEKTLYSIKGAHLPIKKGSTIEVFTKEQRHPKYGTQYHVEDIISEHFENDTGLINFLSSDKFVGIGKATATEIVEFFGQEVIDILTKDPDRIFETGLNESKQQAFYDLWVAFSEENSVILELINYGFTVGQAKKIYKSFGVDSTAKIRTNVYEFIQVEGVSFSAVDRIALLNGYEYDNHNRLQSASIYCLSEEAGLGHCYSEYGNLVTKVQELTQVTQSQKIFDAIDVLVKTGDLVKEGTRVYLQFLHYAEQKSAHILTKINETFVPKYDSEYILNFIAEFEKENLISFDDNQKKAIVDSITKGVNIITGGPGTGKSTITKAICSFFIEHHFQYAMCAPTGRAAKRISEVTSLPASTIHRLLEYKNGFWSYNSSRPLPVNYLIVDESSMVDIQLAYYLLDALYLGAKIIFIGDVNQLPSVGPGQFLYDLISSKKFTTTYLTTIYRQGKDSFLIEVANSILQKDLIEMPTPRESQGANCVLVTASQEEDVKKSLEILLTKSLIQGGYTLDDIQILTPMRKGNLGSLKLNQFLKPIFNPSTKFVNVNGFEYSVGDKIMHIKNNYKLGLFGKFNGDIGKITNIDEKNDSAYAQIQFDDELVTYTKEDMNEIMPAFASTTHKAQGCEYPVVICVFNNIHFRMLTPRLCYTAITRAKKLCIVIGSYNHLYNSLKTNSDEFRNTSLKEFLVQF